MKHSVSGHTAASPRLSPDTDYYSWLNDQAGALRSVWHGRIDYEALAEEVEATAAVLKRALTGELEVLLLHLLKWAWQPEKRTASWEASIGNARDHISDLLTDSPSLKTHLEESLIRAYPRARRTAGAEIGWTRREWETRLPASCPWQLADILDDDFRPEVSTTA